MKKPLASFLSVLALSLLTACGGGASAAVGTYHLDVEAFVATMAVEMQALPEQERQKVLEGAKASVSGTLELEADGSATMTMINPMGKQEQSGTWKLDGENLTVTMKDEKGKEEPKTLKLKAGTITLEEDMGGKKMTLAFKKK